MHHVELKSGYSCEALRDGGGGGAGAGGAYSPRLRMPFKSSNEDATRVYMTWRARAISSPSPRRGSAAQETRERSQCLYPKLVSGRPTIGEAFKSSSAGVGSFICSLLRHRVGTSISIAPTPVQEWGEWKEGPLSAKATTAKTTAAKEAKTGLTKKS